MSSKLINLKQDYHNYLDKKARHIAYKLSKSQPVTKLILDYIQQLYKSATVDYFDNNHFESAYHNPISSELEFLISRIFYHYSNRKKLNWKVYLRRQVKKTAPDVRIEVGNNTLAIIEIKAKAGWIQHLFSEEKYKEYMNRFRKGTAKGDPRNLIKYIKEQIKKNKKVYKINPSQIYWILPSFTHVHRKKSSVNIKNYINWFSKKSGLTGESLILLSRNPNLDLSTNPARKDYESTRNFEKFINKLTKMT